MQLWNRRLSVLNLSCARYSCMVRVEALHSRSSRAATIGTVMVSALTAVTVMAPFCAKAAPLVWQVEAPSATTTTASPPPSTLEPSSGSRALVWSLDPDPSPVTAGAQPPSAGPGSGTAAAAEPTTTQPPAAAAETAGDELLPNGYPRYGVPVKELFAMPYLGGGMPSGYSAGWGDYYVSLGGATPGKLRDGQIDGSAVVGFGIGDIFKTLAIEFDWGIGSIKNLNANGWFSLSGSRILLDQPRLQIAAGGGVFSALTYGNEGNPEPSTGYGVVTFSTPLRPDRWDFKQVLQFSLGYGGWQFAYLDSNFQGETTAPFTALGLQLTSNAGISASWSPRGTNLNFSYVPFRSLPLYFNVLGSDLFDRSPWGPRAVFFITWGDEFRSALF